MILGNKRVLIIIKVIVDWCMIIEKVYFKQNIHKVLKRINKIINNKIISSQCNKAKKELKRSLCLLSSRIIKPK